MAPFDGSLEEVSYWVFLVELTVEHSIPSSRLDLVMATMGTSAVHAPCHSCECRDNRTEQVSESPPGSAEALYFVF